MPWCVRKCPYCDFNSHAAPERIPQAEYVQALLEDLDEDLPFVGDRPLIAIFFGGGTPSLFSGESIDAFLAGVRARLRCTDDIEVTLEANPGTIERGRFASYRAAGVNRVSLGAQTFDREKLHALGRIHGPDDIHRAVDELVGAGLDNFNLDLMYGLPGQSLQEAITDVSTALELGPTHVSHYQLTLEPGTVFYHRPPPLPDDELTWDMQLACQDVLASRGFEQYEVSAYARAERRCRHNLNYWSYGDYIGIGAGAHGKLTCVDRSQIIRTVRHKQPREFLQRRSAARLVERRVVSSEELPLEFMLNGLRLNSGFDVQTFEARTGLPASAIAKTLASAESRGWMNAEGDLWRVTQQGRNFLNDVQALFLP